MMDRTSDNLEKADRTAEKHQLPEQEVHLWVADPSLMENANVQTACRELLSMEEVQRCGKFMQERDQSLYLTAHAMLRRVLSSYENRRATEWQFVTGQYGKPELVAAQADSGLQFNLSHTPGKVACAVCRDVPIGVDVESLERNMNLLALAERYFSQQETEALQALPTAQQKQRFIQYWTLKEAYIKAIGGGMSIPLDSFSMLLPADTLDYEQLEEDQIKSPSAATICFHAEKLRTGNAEADTLKHSGTPADWQFAQFALAPNHLLAVALEKKTANDFKIQLQQASGNFLTTGQNESEVS